MKKLLISAGALLCLGLAILSCSKSDDAAEPILTTERKAALEQAADSVFMAVFTPGLIASISVEGEEDYVLKRGVSTISHYLPGLHVPNGDLITIRMLGNMTTGLYNYTDDNYLWLTLQESKFTNTFPPDSLLAIAFRHPVKFPPGTRHDYCNTNTVLLGLLMEKVTGKPAKQVIREKVIKPMNLTHTYWPDWMFLFSPYTHGYSYQFGELMEATNWNPSWGYTAGALISTIPEMKVWAKAVAEGTLLSENMKAERFHMVENYGFCVMKAGDWIGHAGNIFGYNSHVLFNPVKKITLIILVNQEINTPVEAFSTAFRKILE